MQWHSCLPVAKTFKVRMNFLPPHERKQMKCRLANTEFDYWVLNLLKSDHYPGLCCSVVTASACT